MAKPTYQELEQRIQELEQKHAAHLKTAIELQKSEERFKALHDASFGGIIIHDQGLILDCNQSLSDITGFTNDELVGMNGLELIAPEYLQQVLKNIENGYEHRYEVEGLRKDGSIYPLSIKGKNMPFKDHEVRVIEFRDITERQLTEAENAQLEARLQQAHKMEAVGTLAGGIAHDFNNILGVILGYADLAYEDAPVGSEYSNDISQILVAANRAKDLVKQILDFSHQAQVTAVPIRLQPLIKEGMKMLRSSLPSTITIVDKMGDPPGTILADPTQIHQLLINLCTNAHHAMEPEGGVLTVELRETFVKQGRQPLAVHLTPGRYLEFTLSDTGSGIQPDLVEKIFDPYFTTKDTGKGTGMGLAIVHGIMKKYGGTITVESQLSAGSTFRVYFPVIDHDAQEETQEIPKTFGGAERILLIDDEALLCELSQNIMERMGYQVTAHTNVTEALAVFQKSPAEFDLIMTDQTMPDMTGTEMAKQVLLIRPDIPIILMTGYSNLVDENSAKLMGIREFALKPLTRDDIGVLIRKVLDSQA